MVIISLVFLRLKCHVILPQYFSSNDKGQCYKTIPHKFNAISWYYCFIVHNDNTMVANYYRKKFHNIGPWCQFLQHAKAEQFLQRLLIATAFCKNVPKYGACFSPKYAVNFQQKCW
jgi:hypothetical protein